MSNDAGTRLASSALEFKMTDAVLDAFILNNTVDLERHPDFLDPDKRRYLVVSIDPAAGGEESEEAFILFLCVGSTMGLMGGRVVNGRKPNQHFSTIPLTFVLALLDTVRMAQQTLQTAHARSQFADAKGFVMPTVLVVLETNFAYGAAVYMQMLYMIQTRQNADPSLRTVDILFATPVYSADRETMTLRRDEQRLSAEFQRLKAARTAAQDGLDKNWNLKARTKGLQKAEVLSRIKKAVDQLRVALGVKVVPVEEEEDGPELLDDIVVVLDDDEEEDSAPNIPREKSKLDALIQTEVKTVVDGVLEGVATDDLNKIKDWIPKLQAVLVDVLRTEHQFDLCRSDLRRVQRLIAKRTGEDAPTPEGPFVHTKPWLNEHTVDLASGKVQFPQYYYARAGKQVFGEWTTGSGKVLAFHHFVHLIRDRPLYAFKVIRSGSTAAAAADGNCDRLHQTGSIPAADTVLRCVYQQWSHLGVWSKPSDPKAIVRVEGKQPMRKAKGVHLDDVYMAFTVGLQWIAKFTRLVPTDDERSHLVEYMRNVRGRFHAAMQTNLRSASRVELDAFGNEIREDDVIVPLAPGPAIMPAPVTTKHIDALVVVGALVRRVALVTHSLYVTLRRTILAHAVCGHRTHGGYVLSIRTIQRVSFPAKTWKALVVQELVRMGTTPVTHVEKLFARSTQTVRLVCLDGPGPRFAWPATDRTLKRMRRGDFCDRTFAHAVQVVDGLRVLTAAVLRDYGPSHPLFAAPSLSSLLDYTLQRMMGIMRECADVMQRAPRDVLRVCRKKSMDELCSLFLERPPDPPHPPKIPMCLLLGTGIMSEDILFLRRLQTFNRTRLLRVMHQQALKQWTVDTRPLEAPQLDCRLSKSDRTDWKQAYRTMWPGKFESMASTGKRSVSTYMLLQTESPLS